MAGLPLSEARKLQNINFITCSNSVSAVEMTDALVNELLKLEEGIVVFDCVLGMDVLVISPVMCILCDNARASEFCRKCMV